MYFEIALLILANLFITIPASNNLSGLSLGYVILGMILLDITSLVPLILKIQGVI